MATDVLHTKTQLAAPLVIDLANNSLEYKFWAALRDPSNGPLTIEAQGSDEGARAFILEALGDWIEFPVHGIRIVTLTAANYPCWIGYGIVREAARVNEQDATLQGIGIAGYPTGGVVTVQGFARGSTELLANAGAFSPILDDVTMVGQVGANGGTTRTPLATAITGVDSTGYLRTYRIASTFKIINAVSVTSGTPVSIWTPASGKKFRLMGGGVSLSVAGAIKFEDGAGNVIWQTPTLVAGQPYNLPENFSNGIQSSAANNVLYIDVTASGVVNGGVFGTEE